MSASTTLTGEQRRAIYKTELRNVLRSLAPNCPGDRFSGAQVARAKGIARRNALEIIDALAEANHA